MAVWQQKKTLGVALGGGGVRGLAHIGLLRELDKAGITISALTGTSMGSMIGAVYALGIPMRTFVEELKKYAPKKYLGFQTLNIFNESLLKGDDFDQMLQELFGEKKIEDCPIPFSCTAVDIESGKLVNLTEGLIWKAVRASSSLPFIFPPVFHEDRLLVDGGVIDNLPLQELRKFKTQVVLGSRVNSLESRQLMSADIYNMYYPTPGVTSASKNKGPKFHQRVKFMWDILMRTMEIAMDDASAHRVKASRPDLLVETLVPVGLIEMEKGDVAIELGDKSMRDKIEELKGLLG